MLDLDDAAAADDIGRRERKKQETRDALVAAALELFVARGVDATTVDEIADAVDVSARTFHRYFPTKEDVLFADSERRQTAFAAFLAERPDDEGLFDTLRTAAHRLADSFLNDPAIERQRMTLIATSYNLRARSLQHTDALNEIVAEHVAKRLRVEPGEPLPRLLAACTIAALRTARERWLADVSVDYHAEIDQCFALVADLRGATAAFRPRQIPTGAAAQR